MTLQELNGYVMKWQKILRLQDWDVDVQFEDKWNMEGAVGLCTYDLTLPKAWIKIVHPEQQPGEDPEATVVHELLHIKAAAFHNENTGWLKGAKLDALEVMIETTAQALVGLDRKVQIAHLEGKQEAIGEVLKELAVVSDTKPRVV